MVFLSLLLSALLSLTPVQTAAVPEYRLKATFLFQFTQFVDWPAGAFATRQAPLVIGVLGEDPFGTFLDEAVRGETVNNRALVIVRYRRLEDVANCHVLFVSPSEAGKIREVIAALKGRSILTVGETDGFADRGGIIQFATQDNRIRLRINLEAAKAANLTISSKLLRPATVINSGAK
jgi:hypothetical protein